MLPTSARLTTAEQFGAVMRSGYRVGTRHVSIHLRKSNVEEPPRAGFVVSTKVGNSVVRHRVTRRLRHQIQPVLAWLPAGAQVVVRALPIAAAADSSVLGMELQTGISRAVKKLYGHVLGELSMGETR